jgi:hypothetical protein
LRKFEAPELLNPKSQKTNIKKSTMPKIQKCLDVETLRFVCNLMPGIWDSNKSIFEKEDLLTESVFLQITQGTPR